MQTQRRVADQHGALAVNVVARDARERMQMALADPREAAEALAERRLELGAERVVGQRRDALARPPSGSVQITARAAARQRQQRDRAALA